MLGYVDAAERIRRAKNPVTAHGSNLSKRSRQPRARAINQADEDALKSYFNQRGDISMVSAILIFKNAGIRPAELSGLRVDGNRLIVTGAKKSQGGKRGGRLDFTVGWHRFWPAQILCHAGTTSRRWCDAGQAAGCW